VMRVELVTPDDCAAFISADLISRRGRLESTEGRGATLSIKAMVPLSEMLDYASDLRSHTQGRASYMMHFDRYEPLSNGPDIDNKESGAPVMAPRRPAPKGKPFGIALPRPDDGG